MPPWQHITELLADVQFTLHFKTQAFEHIEHPGRNKIFTSRSHRSRRAPYANHAVIRADRRHLRLASCFEREAAVRHA